MSTTIRPQRTDTPPEPGRDERAIHDLKLFAFIPEVEPGHLCQRMLQNQRSAVLAHALRRHTDVVVCRLGSPVRAG